MSGVRPVRIGKKFRRALAKLVMGVAGDQAKTVCGNLQICTVLKDGMEGEKHAVRQQIIERVRA